MRKFLGIAAVCLLAIGGALIAADKAEKGAKDEKKLESGLPVGESVPAFNVRDITGPSKGKTLCYRCQYGDRPVVAVFTRKIDDNVTSLIKQIDAEVVKNADKKMAAFIVLITDKADEMEPKLEKIAKDEKIEKTPLTIIDGKSGPDEYKIAEDAEVTVMMWNESKVAVNHAYAAGKLEKKSVATLVGETKKILE